MVISGALVLDPTSDNGNNPLIGWQNLATISNVSVDTAAVGYPGSNLANPATYPGAEWQGSSTSEQTMAVALDGVTDFDYVAVANHNFGSGRIPVSIDVLIGATWTEVIPSFMPNDDSPILWRLGRQQGRGGVRVHMFTGDEAPRCAVLYAGTLLVCERRMYVDHAPLTDGTQVSSFDSLSESGNYLGSIVVGEWRSSSILFRLISPAWHRLNTRPFLEAAKRKVPFFFAWRPSDYPLEVGYCWLTGSAPMPTPVSDGGNRLQFQLDVQGIM